MRQRASKYTLVVGVDHRHLRQLSWTWPTWQRHKPTMTRMPMIVFYDRDQVTEDQILDVLEDHPELLLYAWPPEENIVYDGDPSNKFYHPQRHKMLSGFVHVPAQFVYTEYWLKVDTDVIAHSKDDWVDPEWFRAKNEIISHRWSYTKPPDQIVRLDDWAKRNEEKLTILSQHEPLNMAPEDGAEILSHKRIISWCAFFGTAFTRWASDQATRTCGPCQLPVPSQDGYLWYIAKRMGFGISRQNMKSRGWMQWSTEANIRKHAVEAMQ